MDHYEVLGLSPERYQGRNQGSVSETGNGIPPGQALSLLQLRQGRRHPPLQASPPTPTKPLIDDRKRADYNHRSYNNNNGPTTTGFNSSSYGYSPRSGTNSSYGYYRRARNGDAFVSKIEIALRYLKTRSFLLNLAFAG
ncbi:hypothetical protein Acr_12g0006370 [Actinidia rufa]|uniref:Uncharacterized protein n=1 Tax=Actinidia rufa TaxID=165716 RepID=A0A7J0FI24_9ERIC|nr:hypothetical protein Acr_12g0006370 [Actinidia rufa]